MFVSSRGEPSYDLIPLGPTRQAIAERVTRSKRDLPQFTIWAQVDCTRITAYRDQLKAQGADPLPTFNDLFIYIVARRVKDHPRFNAWRMEDGLHSFKVVNLGFAVATDAGVMLPTVYDADRKPLSEIAKEARELSRLAREGRLRASLQMNAGFTISNIGPVAVEGFDAIISPPQTGILAIGPILPRPWVRDGQLEARPVSTFVLTVDHASADGAEGARFLADIKRDVESFEGA